MTGGGVPADRLNRIVTAIETIEESLGILARKQRVSRAEYKSNSDTRDIVERRFVKMTEAAIDRDTSAYPRLPVSDECSDTLSEPRSEQAGVERTA